MTRSIIRFAARIMAGYSHCKDKREALRRKCARLVLQDRGVA